MFYSIVINMIKMFARSVSELFLQKVLQDVYKHPVLIYSKTYCPYCVNAKKVLKEMQVEPSIIELDTVKEGKEIEEALNQITKQETVPNIFILGNHIGGYSDLKQGLKEGKVQEILKEGNVLFKTIDFASLK